MVNSKLILATVIMLFGSSANAGIIASLEALIARSTANSMPEVLVDITKNPGTEINITSIIDAIEEDLGKIDNAIPVVQSTGSSVSDNQLTLPDISFPASIEPEMLEQSLLAANTHAEGFLVSAPVVAQPVPAPPVLWLFGIGLIGLVGSRRQGKAA